MPQKAFHFLSETTPTSCLKLHPLPDQTNSKLLATGLVCNDSTDIIIEAVVLCICMSIYLSTSQRPLNKCLDPPLAPYMIASIISWICNLTTNISIQGKEEEEEGTFNLS